MCTCERARARYGVAVSRRRFTPEKLVDEDSGRVRGSVTRKTASWIATNGIEGSDGKTESDVKTDKGRGLGVALSPALLTNMYFA